MSAKKLDTNRVQLIRRNTSLVKKLYPNINRTRIQALKELTKQFSFSFASGDVIQLENGWFVTHTGLVRLARRKRCRGIHVEAVDSLCDSAANRFVAQGDGVSVQRFRRFCRLRRCRPFQCFSARPRRRDADRRNPSRQLCCAKIVKFFLVCVSRLAFASDRGPPRFVSRHAREGTRFVDSSSGAPASQGLRSSLSGWLLFG